VNRYAALSGVLAILMSLGVATVAQAAIYPLELTNIKPSGGGLHSGNRIYRAYPGLLYNIRAAVVGGDYPYTYTLTAAPAGMTINASTGEISWPNPQSNAQATIVVRDSAGAQVSATWSIQVTTAGFRFLDAVNGNSSGAGTLQNPWRTMADAYTKAQPSDILYFRAGTYNQLTLPRTGTGGFWERVEWTDQPSIWLAYPGERPIIDFGYRAGAENAPLIRLDGDNVYVDGFETINSRLIAFQYNGGNIGPTFRKMRMHRHGPGIDGSNASFIMTVTGGAAYGGVIQDSEFYELTGDATTLKIYSLQKLLIENTVHHTSSVGIELKDDIPQFTVRGNVFYGIDRFALGGNMHETSTYGEILYNYIRSNQALQVNNDGMARRIDTYRNTFVGRVQVTGVGADNGPFTFSNNVIVNSDSGTPAGSHIYHDDVDAPNRIILSNNLAGNPNQNIVDANGNLTASYAQYVGTHGHQRPGGTTPGTTLPPAPRNLRIVP
jgi:hypothetical protein